MLNAAAQSIEDIRAARINRESDSKIAHTALANNAHNVLLYGTPEKGSVTNANDFNKYLSPTPLILFKLDVITRVLWKISTKFY